MSPWDTPEGQQGSEGSEGEPGRHLGKSFRNRRNNRFRGNGGPAADLDHGRHTLTDTHTLTLIHALRLRDKETCSGPRASSFPPNM